MNIEVRDLSSDRDIAACVALQKEIWGMDDACAMSPITLKALTMASPKMGLLSGAFAGENMVAVLLALPSFVPGVAYGHMLGVLEAYRDANLGHRMTLRLFEQLRALGCHRVVWTFEPLESRNAHLYINKMGGRVTKYCNDYFMVEDEMNRGLPLDRFLYEADLTGTADKPTGAVALKEALAAYPVATPDHMPDCDAVLVEIPASLQELKAVDYDRALSFRMDTRIVFNEYINRREFVVDRLLSDVFEDGRRSFYLVHKR